MVWPPCASGLARALRPSWKGLREIEMSDDDPTGSGTSRPDTSEAEAQHVLGMVAHEIKNLLGPLGMALQMCERRVQQGEPAGKEDLAFARVQVRSLSDLVHD